MSESEQIPTDEPAPEPTPTPDPPKRNDKGQFKPKKKGETPPEPATKTASERYFDKREAELYEHLKEITSPSELEDFEQLTRIKMMELLLKKNPKEVKKIVNPLNPNPPIEKPIPTLMERNRRDLFMKDIQKKGSYVGFMDNLRKRK